MAKIDKAITDQIPHHIVEQIKSGNVVLFLGAGASLGTKNKKNESMPDGQGLSDLLANKFLGVDFLGKPLSHVANLSISESSIFDVQKFIADYLRDFEPEDFHLKIPTFPWKAIITTNYDLLVEKSYEKIKKNHIQELRPVYKNTARKDIFTNEKVVPYYKIHGCINDINDIDAPLVLTTDQFINSHSKRENLYKELQELSINYPILFVGFKIEDYDIRAILNNLDANMSARVRSYMVIPSINKIEEKMWDTTKKISTIQMTFANFIKCVDELIEPMQRKLGSIKPDTKYPIYSKFSIDLDKFKPTENFLSFINNNIDFIHPNLTAPNTIPKDFYKGYFDNWDPIIKNLDINRTLKDGILFECFMDETNHISDDQYFYLIKGNAGSGKSVLLKRLAFDAGNTLERFCIVLRDGAPLKVPQIIELYTYVKERIYLFIDDVSLIESEIIYLLNKCKKDNVKLTIIGAERIGVWNTECENLSKNLTESYQIKYLHDKEILELIQKLDMHNSLGSLKDKTEAERILAFSERAGRELLLALYEATNFSKPFEDIIFDEYQKIHDVRAQSLYLTVCIFHRLGAEARSGFISRVHNIGFHEFKEKLFKPLESIVYDKKDNNINDFVYITRNKLIAEIVFEKVLKSPQDRYDEYIRVLNHINVDYDSDRLAFLAITNAKKLLSVFPDPDMVRRIFEVAEKQQLKDPKLLQQKAIFEINSLAGNIVSAELYLKEAHSILPNDPIISHTLAEMMLKKAERAKYAKEFLAHIDSCLNICDSIISKFPNNSHPYHTKLKALILKLKTVFESDDSPSIERTIKDIEKVFAIAKQYFPNEQFILEIESSFNELINNKNNAKDLLEKAFKANKASPFIALRLANFYERENDYLSASSVIRESLEQGNSGDRELNFKYGLLLEKRDEPNFDNIIYHLRRSFTMGDSRYQAQFWYARALYIKNEFVESKKIFDTLSKVNVSPDIKKTPTGKLRRSNQAMIFEGVIITVEVSYGFIRRDSFGDNLYFFRFEEDYNWDNFKSNKRVSFKIGFNYRGAVALNIRLI